jgi:hypothetical protein
MLDVAAVVDRIPEIDRIPSVDGLLDSFRELAQQHPRLFRLSEIGTARLGEPLLMLSAGTGSRQALMVGGPHPNEPIGFLTLLQFARLLAEDADLRDGLGYTWNLIPCIDPVGARLNEGWYAGPMTVENYHRNFYRPALGHQPEWTFPVRDGGAYFDRTLPETQALMRVIDDLRPHFQYSLHNADFGGAYFILSRDVPGLASELTDAARTCNVPVELAPSEATGWQVAGPAVFVMPPAREMEFTQEGSDAGRRAHGASSLHYAEQYGSLTLITEVPMWSDTRLYDGWTEHRPYTQTVRTLTADLRQALDELAESLRRATPDLRMSSVFHAAVTDTMAIGRSYVDSWEKAAEAPKMCNDALTPAVLAGFELTSWRMPLRAAAMLMRLLRIEYEAGNNRPALCAELQATEERFARACARIGNGAFRRVPFKDLVALQLSAALTVISHL